MTRSLVRLLVFAPLVLLACDAPVAPVAPAVPAGITDQVAEGRGQRGKKPKPDPEPPDSEPVPPYAWYELTAAADVDPLHRFGLAEQTAKLETDPTVAGWGTDYWGYWSEPFPFDGRVVRYTIGLTHTTYELSPLAGGGFDVTKTLVVQPYLGGEPTTTVTHVGVFAPEG